MNDDEPRFRFQDPTQRVIYDRLLSLIGPGPAAMFRDACALVDDPKGLDSVNFIIGHLAREVESAVRAIVVPGPAEDGKPSQIPVHLDEAVVRAVNEAGITERIRDRLLQHWERRPDDTRNTEIRRVAQFLAGDDENAAKILESNWRRLNLQKSAHRSGLGLPRRNPEDVVNEWNNLCEILRFVLDRLEAKYEVALARVDRLLEAPTPPDSLRDFNGNIPNSPAIFKIFFEGLIQRKDAADWMSLIRDARLFDAPPSPVVDHEEGTYKPVYWHQCDYLKHVASERPNDVCEVILTVPTSDNIGVHDGLAQVALALPYGELSAEQTNGLADKASEWVQIQHRLRLLSSISGLSYEIAGMMNRMLDAGHKEAAVRVASSVWGVDDGGEGASANGYWTGLQPWVGEWDFAELAKAHATRLISATAETGFNFFISLLVKAALAENNGKTAESDDLVWITWPSIEEHEQNGSSGRYASHPLIRAVRDGAEVLSGFSGWTTDMVAENLLNRSNVTCRRIALNFIRKHVSQLPQLAAREVANRKNFELVPLHHEYLELVRDSWLFIDEPARTAYLTWVKDEVSYSSEDVEPSEDDTELLSRQNAAWKLARLAPIAEQLVSEWRDYHDSLVELAGGQPEHPEFLTWSSSGWVGRRSPWTADELVNVDDAELVRRLSDWKPTPELFGPSTSDLASALKEAVRCEPAHFAALADKLVGLNSEYLASVFSGLGEALEQNKTWPWEHVISLAQAVAEAVEQPQGASEDWLRWAKQQTASLLSRALTNGSNQPSAAQRDQVWGIIKHLAQVPDPPFFDSSVRFDDPLIQSLNCVRGVAINAAVMYAIWVSDLEVAAGGSAHLPHEVQELLNERLEPVNDHAPAIRAAIGRWLTNLVALDREWVIDHLEVLFPSNFTELRAATWYGYIVTSNVYTSPFEVLADEYSHQIEQLALGPAAGSHIGRYEPDKRLGDHLMRLFGSGQADTGNAADLLAKFFDKANPDTRAAAIDTVGRGLKNTSAALTESQMERFRKFWESRIENATQSDQPLTIDAEMASFTSWFVSRRLPPEIGLELYRASLELTSSTDKTWRWREALEVLEALANDHPEQAFACLNAILARDPNGWVMVSNQERVRAILETCLCGASPAVRTAARETVNRLIAKGNSTLRDLL